MLRFAQHRSQLSLLHSTAANSKQIHGPHTNTLTQGSNVNPYRPFLFTRHCSKIKCVFSAYKNTEVHRETYI